MKKQIKGTVFKFGDNINTDIISPPQYIELTVEEAAKHSMEAVDPTFTKRFQPGDIVEAEMEADAVRLVQLEDADYYDTLRRKMFREDV